LCDSTFSIDKAEDKLGPFYLYNVKSRAPVTKLHLAFRLTKITHLLTLGLLDDAISSIVVSLCNVETAANNEILMQYALLNIKRI
jgi:hypothetical protein